MRRMRSTGPFKFGPFFSMLCNYAIGCLYGHVTNDSGIVFSRASSAMVTLYYMWVFYRVRTPEDEAEMRMWGLVAAVGGLLLFGLMAFGLPTESRVHALGGLGLVASVFMSAAPLLNLRAILRTRSAASIPFGMTVTTIVCNTAWGVYGNMRGDSIIAAQNFSGVGFSVVQLGLILLFGRGDKHDAAPPDVEVEAGADLEAGVAVGGSRGVRATGAARHTTHAKSGARGVAGHNARAWDPRWSAPRLQGARSSPGRGGVGGSSGSGAGDGGGGGGPSKAGAGSARGYSVDL